MTEGEFVEAGDMDGDGVITIADVTAIIDILVNNNPDQE